MGLLDSIVEFLSGSKSDRIEQPQVNEEYEKERLAHRIVHLVSEIKKITSFDSCLWNLSNVNSFELRERSFSELQSLNSSLEKRLSKLENEMKSKKADPTREALEEAKWTGRIPDGMSVNQFDRLQRSDDGR